MATQVLILAAGRGSRLGPRTADVPKPLLQVGPRTLVEHQLEMFAEAGVGPVGMVLGYQADEIAEVVGIRAEYIINSRWAVTNSLYSFLQARNWVQGDLIISNCDILLHPAILERLLETGGDALAYDSSSGHGLEHMKVQLSEDQLVRMSKSMPPEAASGENVGILYLKAETVRALFEVAERVVAAGRTKDWLGVAVQEVAAQRKLRGVDIAGLPWAEIDFAFDLNRARKEVWPAIRGRLTRGKRRAAGAAGIAAAALVLVTAVGAFTPGDDQREAVDWRTLQVDGGSEVVLQDGGRQQTWWRVDHKDGVRVRVRAAAQVRVESRALLPAEVARLPYRLDIQVHGEEPRWRQHEAVASGSAKHDESGVSLPIFDYFLNGAETQVPIHVRGSGPAGVAVLVRIREAETVFADQKALEDRARPRRAARAAAFLIPRQALAGITGGGAALRRRPAISVQGGLHE
jgi:L-glutamine-phosphate cytidylyltransferase